MNPPLAFQWKPAKQPRVRRGLRAVSRQRQAEVRRYRRLNKEFAAAHPFCEVASGGVLGKPLVRRSTETHHRAGKEGRLLCMFEHCIRVSRAGHRWIEDHGEEARARGWLYEVDRAGRISRR